MSSLERRLRRLEETPTGNFSIPPGDCESFFEYLLWHVIDAFYWHTITRSRYEATELESNLLGCALGIHGLREAGRDGGEWLFPSGCVARWDAGGLGGNIVGGRIEIEDLPEAMRERLGRLEDTGLDAEKRILWLHELWAKDGRPGEPGGSGERRREVNWLEGGIPGGVRRGGGTT